MARTTITVSCSPEEKLLIRAAHNVAEGEMIRLTEKKYSFSRYVMDMLILAAKIKLRK